MTRCHCEDRCDEHPGDPRASRHQAEVDAEWHPRRPCRPSHHPVRRCEERRASNLGNPAPENAIAFAPRVTVL